MMKQSIENRAGDDGIAEDFAPGTETLIASNDDRAALVSARDQLEEQVRAVTIDRQVSDLIPDQKSRLSEQLEALVELALGRALPSVAISAAAVTKRVRTPCSEALIPSAIAK
jgi:hypothetical protein